MLFSNMLAHSLTSANSTSVRSAGVDIRTHWTRIQRVWTHPRGRADDVRIQLDLSPGDASMERVRSGVLLSSDRGSVSLGLPADVFGGVEWCGWCGRLGCGCGIGVVEGFGVSEHGAFLDLGDSDLVGAELVVNRPGESGDLLV